MSDPIAVSVKTAAALVDVSPPVIYAAVNAGQLRHKRIGRTIRIAVTDLRAWFDNLEDAS